jgi:hypothetical protein
MAKPPSRKRNYEINTLNAPKNMKIIIAGERLVEDEQYSYQQRPILQETLAAATHPGVEDLL